MKRDELALRLRMKEELRRQMRAVRTRTPEAARQARSQAIVQQLVLLPQWQTARTIAAYVAMPTEVDVSAALSNARAAQKRIVLPRVQGTDPELSLRLATEDLEETPFGYRQPRAGTPEVPDAEVDLIICPALAVDGRGYRIGWGKGYYDRLLRRTPQALPIAVVFDFQIIPDAPHTKGDVPVGRIVSDRRMIDCRASDTLAP